MKVGKKRVSLIVKCMHTNSNIPPKVHSASLCTITEWEDKNKEKNDSIIGTNLSKIHLFSYNS